MPRRTKAQLEAEHRKLLDALDKLTDALFLYEEESGYRDEGTYKTEDVKRRYKEAVNILKSVRPV